jgi:single-strand selective monofunctional uracil DNA glycosylase
MLRVVAEHIQPRWILGVGKFGEARAREVFEPGEYRIGSILHPSPASPKANRGWAPQAEAELDALGVEWQP